MFPKQIVWTVTRRTWQTLAMLAVLAGSSQAQPSFQVTFGGAFDSFRPTASVAESRENLAGALNLEHVFAGSRGRVAYDLDAGDYDSPGDWTFLRHTGTLTYRFGSDDPAARKLYLNASFVARANGDAWAAADYSAISGGLNSEFHPTAAWTLRAGYRVDYRRFANETALTQFEHRGFASALVNFESRTTLIGEIQLGVKRYDGVVYTAVPAGEVPAPVPVTVGRGPGGMQGAAPGIRWTLPAAPGVIATSQDGAGGMATVMGRVAQSLTDRTGMHVQVMRRQTFGAVPPALVVTPAGFFEDGVYDDPFASDGLFLQVGLKRAFAGGAELEATGWRADKHYPSALALGEDGLALPGALWREDTVTTATVTWSQPLFAARSGAVAVTADLGYRYIRHRSNDAFYQYTSHAAIVGFSIGY